MRIKTAGTITRVKSQSKRVSGLSNQTRFCFNTPFVSAIASESFFLVELYFLSSDSPLKTNIYLVLLNTFKMEAQREMDVDLNKYSVYKQTESGRFYAIELEELGRIKKIARNYDFAFRLVPEGNKATVYPLTEVSRNKFQLLPGTVENIEEIKDLDAVGIWIK